MKVSLSWSVIGLFAVILLAGCSNSGSVTSFDENYGQLIAESMGISIEGERDGMYKNQVVRMESVTGLGLDEYAVQCTAMIMNFAGGEMPDNLKGLIIEYKKGSVTFKSASQGDQITAMQFSDLIEGKFLTCLRSGSLKCCGQQS